MAKKRDKNAVRRLWLTWILAVVLFVSTVLGGLQLGAIITMKTWEHWTPNYEKQDLGPILAKQTLTDEDYAVLYRQTGLTKLGVDGLLQAGNVGRIYRIQDVFFTPAELDILQYTLFTYIEYMQQSLVFANLEPGDIVVSASTYVSGFRYGHGALVVDGERMLMLESFAPGTLSEISNLQLSMGNLANVIVLRPKCPKAIREEVARRAKTELLKVPYSMFAGIFTPKYTEELKSTQCTHLVWYAYKKYAGLDLDANGGAVVKPQDIFLSDQVEVVQFYGFNPDTLWS